MHNTNFICFLATSSNYIIYLSGLHFNWGGEKEVLLNMNWHLGVFGQLQSQLKVIWHKNCCIPSLPCAVFSLWCQTEKFSSFLFSFGEGRGGEEIVAVKTMKKLYFLTWLSLPALHTMSLSGVDDHWNASTQQQVLAFILFTHSLGYFPLPTCLFRNKIERHQI